MCVEVLIGGIICSTPRQLAAHIGGGDRIEWVDRRGEMDWCLCVIDVPRTLERSALKWAREGGSETFVVER